ncbi:MAG: thioredoxin [Thermoplasmata archaeon]|nr:MAG: thioredoxin [Thermoplasmata archaeon]
MDELEEIRRRKLKKMLKEHFPDEPIILSDENFDKVINRYQLVLVDFWAPWCLPCKIVAPILEEFAKKYRGKIVIGKLDVDRNPITASKFGIFSIPTLILFRNGKAVQRIVGAVPKEHIESIVKPYL